MKKKIYLYDPRYNLKKETTYKKLEGITGYSYDRLTSARSKKNRILKLWYIVDDTTTAEELYGYYTKIHYTDEIWKEIEGADGEFLVSNYGRFKKRSSNGEFVFMLPKPVVKKTKTGKVNISLRIWLKFRGRKKEYLVSRLVAYHFVDIYYEGSYRICKHKPEKYKNLKFEDLFVIHKNGLEYDNYHGNLEYLDKADFSKYLNSRNIKKNILVYNAHSGELIDIFSTRKEAARSLGISETSIDNNLYNRRTSNIVNNKYLFKYDNDDIDIDETVNHKIVYKRNAGVSVVAIDIKSRKIVAQEDSIVKMHKALGVSTPSISKSLKEEVPTRPINNRYVFRYANSEINVDEIIEGLSLDSGNSRSVTAIDLDLKKIIGQYRTIAETSRVVGISEKAIRNNLAKKDSYHAIFDRYVFRYTASDFTIEDILSNLKVKNTLGKTEDAL